MEIEKIVFLVKHPATFNYAVVCAAFNLDDKPRILLVDYQEKEWHKPQNRLPAGRFQAKDLLDSISWLLEKKGSNAKLEFFYGEVSNLNKIYLSLASLAENHKELNIEFNKFTAKLLTKFYSCGLSELESNLIFERTYVNTAIHELTEEAGVEKIKNIYISSSALLKDDHYQIGVISTEVEAPVHYFGTSDPKVPHSFWGDIDENTLNNLFNGHKSKFQEGIRRITELKIHPNFEKLKDFATASQ